ncbi:uncharacterized protein LOC114719467 [Neltuma alba]|uniref:uncharacterized protein LOC114719467 n=1 Tax=Neltuma alba TaxID=207710 RepID=UPI0010A468D1|nr:uncharacterized protein LOC114719467 [Prosopis alba]
MQLVEVHKAPLINHLSRLRIIGSSNGLVCIRLPVFSAEFRMYIDSFLVWNPATREDELVLRTIDFLGDCYLGFGFSPVVNDYKIVKIYGYKEYFDNGFLFRVGTKSLNGVDVYALSTGLWKQVEFGNLEGLNFYADAATVSGAVFWLGIKQDVEGEDGHGRCHFIVLF